MVWTGLIPNIWSGTMLRLIRKKIYGETTSSVKTKKPIQVMHFHIFLNKLKPDTSIVYPYMRSHENVEVQNRFRWIHRKITNFMCMWTRRKKILKFCLEVSIKVKFIISVWIFQNGFISQLLHVSTYLNAFRVCQVSKNFKSHKCIFLKLVFMFHRRCAFHRIFSQQTLPLSLSSIHSYPEKREGWLG